MNGNELHGQGQGIHYGVYWKSVRLCRYERSLKYQLTCSPVTFVIFLRTRCTDWTRFLVLIGSGFDALLWSQKLFNYL